MTDNGAIMKNLILTLAFVIPIQFLLATEANHNCFIRKNIQTMNLESGQSIFLQARTVTFEVTKQEHEPAYELSLSTIDGQIIGKVSVDTGTLIGTNEGDLIQAHANLNIEGNQEYLGLIMDISASKARAHRFWIFESEVEVKMINIDLQCEISKKI